MPQAAARLVRICEMGAGCLVPVTARAAAPEESSKAAGHRVGNQRNRWGSTSMATLTFDGGGRPASHALTARCTLSDRSVCSSNR